MGLSPAIVPDVANRIISDVPVERAASTAAAAAHRVIRRTLKVGQ